MIADNTVTGEGIVLAQRLEQLSEPGGVCIQDAAYQTVPKRLAFSYENLGERTVKGFDEPVRAYAVSRALEAPTAEPVAATDFKPVSLDLPEKPSIAVLPFANMSGDPEQEYFSDGITEDIITALSRISGLLVVARNSTAVYKGKAVDVKQVGHEQGVRHVLEGSVRRAGNRIRVTAQLIDAATGHHQWADRYDRELDDIFAVQDDITRNISIEMQVQLSSGEQTRMLAGRTNNTQAWECVRRAADLSTLFTREDNLESRRLAEEALELDSKYVGAWEMVGWSHVQDALFEWSESREKSTAQALEAATKALELDENYPDAFAVLALVHLLHGEHDRAVEVAKRAANLAPSHAENTMILGLLQTLAGQTQEALSTFTRGMRLSPVCPSHYLANQGLRYHSMHQNEQAIEMLRKAVGISTESAAWRGWLVSALAEQGLLEEAKAAAQELLRIEPNYSASQARRAGLFKDAKVNERIAQNLIKAGIPE